MFIVLLLFVFLCFFVAGNIAYLLLNDSDNPDRDLSRKKQKIILVALWFPLMATWFVVTYTAYNNSQSDLRESELKFKLQDLQRLESTHNDAMNAADNLNATFFDINTFIETERLFCQNGQYTGNRQEFLVNQYQRLLKLEQISFPMRIYFGDKVYESVLGYLEQIEKDTFLCENPAASEDLIAIQTDINQLIDEKINENLEHIKSLKTDLE